MAIRCITYTVCLDPGADTGWALYRDGVLIMTLAGKRTPEDTRRCLEAFQEMITLCTGKDDHMIVDLVCEMPVIYSYSKSKGNPNGLLKLVLQIGWAQGWTSHWYRSVTYTPRTWKGAVSKRVHNNRVIAALYPTERGNIVSLSNGKPNHNVIDAAGIGLHHINRMRGGRTL